MRVEYSVRQRKKCRVLGEVQVIRRDTDRPWTWTPRWSGFGRSCRGA